MKPKGIHNITGFLLLDMDKPVFRVYDPTDKSKFTDYEINHPDLKITINDNSAVIVDNKIKIQLTGNT